MTSGLPSVPDPSPAGRARRSGQPMGGPLAMDDPTAALYSVGQVAAMLGLQHAFLRRLDGEQVVSPSRSPGGQRRYSRNEVEAVDRVATLMDDGMSLASIRHIIALEAEVADLRRQLAAATKKR